MKKKIYVYQKEYDINHIDINRYTCFTTPYSYFYEKLKEYSLYKYLISNKTVKKYLFIYNVRDNFTQEMIFKIPFKERKIFQTTWLTFKQEREIEKGFLIKE